MNPFRPHFCMPRSTPQATARRLVIERCNELRAGPCEKPTRNVVEDILSDITSPKFDAFPIGERRVMVDQIATPYGNARDNLRRTLQRNQQRGLNPRPPRPTLVGKTRKQKIKAETISPGPASPAPEVSTPPTTSSSQPIATNIAQAVKVAPPRRFVCAEPIRTLVFMDLACSHVFPGLVEAQRRCTPDLLGEPSLYADNLKRLIMETINTGRLNRHIPVLPSLEEPTATGAFLPIDCFTSSRIPFKSPDQSFVLRLSANVRTSQINPELSREQWHASHNGKASDSAVVCRPKDDLELKRTFAEEWPAMREFLDSCAKPVCLISHKGMIFDFRALYGELTRCGFIEKGLGIPKGVVFVDSLLAIREIEKGYCKEVFEATKELSSSTDSGSSDTPSKLDNTISCVYESPSTMQDVAAYEDIVEENNVGVKSSLKVDTSRAYIISGRDEPKGSIPVISPPKKKKAVLLKRDCRGGWEFIEGRARNLLENDLPVLYETIVTVVSCSESRAARAGPSIVLDDDDAPQDVEVNSSRRSTTSTITHKRRSRSQKLQGDVEDEVEIIKVEEVVERSSEPENRPPDSKRPRKAAQNSTTMSFVRTTRRSTYRSSPKRDSSPVPAVEPSGSPKVEKEKLATADEVVKKIEELLSTSSVHPSPEKTSSQERNGNGPSTDWKRSPYIVKFTLLMMRRV
ncbi:unnamed protein product [Heligmosomoides polygyrus]|uniref:Exonuclease domain-containing protein n=1 Tax=Heligmosomoides polygyrus TaxID=6339 RepID=A0A3P7YZ87_HELPZ|nr:unnamed protein product [Heligmosomoides polygyrus]